MFNLYIVKIIRKIRLIILRSKLKNKTPTIISNSCKGTFMYHDLKLKFNSPTINLFFSAEDYIKFLEKMDFYIGLELVEKEDNNQDYPIGTLGDIQIHFMHYDTFESAKSKWNERCSRIDKDNMYIVMDEGADCTYNILQRFDALKYNNKVIFTHKVYNEFKSAFYIKGFEKLGYCKELFNYDKSKVKRYYENFDYISFLNGKK